MKMLNMKHLIFFSVFLITSYFQINAQTDIKVVTYNIWFDNPDNTENPWSERKQGVISTLTDLQPDIFCVQEALINQVEDLEFSSYKHVGVGRDDGKTAGEFSAIFYDTVRFELLDVGNFWLSETPDAKGFLGWDAVCVRIATWVQLHDQRTEKEFFVFNTHFDHVGDRARLESAKLIKRKIAEISGTYPVILTGDFNCRKGDAPYEEITSLSSNLKFRDCRYQVKSIKGLDYSFVGSDFIGKPGDIIDHIFVTKQFTVIEFQTYDNCTQGKCPSDHLPVLTLLHF